MQTKLFLLFHGVFSLVAVSILASPTPVGWQFAILVLIYNVSLPLFSKWKGLDEWFRIWKFVLPLSIFQVIPDWFLSAQLEVLVFPEDGFPKIGSVSAYMAGLWVIPLFIILYTGSIFEEKGEKPVWIAVLGVSLLIFGGSEMLIWRLGSWYAQHVHMTAHVAWYVVIPEMILGGASYGFYRLFRHKAYKLQLIIGFLIMLMYTGALACSYFFIEC